MLPIINYLYVPVLRNCILNITLSDMPKFWVGVPYRMGIIQRAISANERFRVPALIDILSEPP
jgi:hypothetical protein